MNLDNILHAALGKEYFCIPKEMIINGSFSAETSGEIAGKVNGNIVVKGRVIILKDGIVHGDIEVEDLIVYGKLTGDVRSCFKLTAHAGAVITGDIFAQEINTDKEAIIQGHIIKPNEVTAVIKKTGKIQTRQNSELTEKMDEIKLLKPASWF
jgi:cytoskeletal protein CcmA (bactofilin family)